MDQKYYEQIMKLKRKGKYQECIDIYLEHKKDEEPDMLYFDGLAKIYMLANNFEEAQKCLWESFYKLFVFKKQFFQKIVEKKINGVEEVMQSSFFLQEITCAVNIYHNLIDIFGEKTLEKILLDYKLNVGEFIICLCACFDETYFRFLFCLVCQNELPDTLSDSAKKIPNEINNVKTSILNVFKGVATFEEQQEYDRVFINFKKDPYKYVHVVSILKSFARFVWIQKVADALFGN